MRSSFRVLSHVVLPALLALPAVHAATTVSDYRPHFWAFNAHDERCPQVANSTLNPADQAFGVTLIVPEPQPGETLSVVFVSDVVVSAVMGEAAIVSSSRVTLQQEADEYNGADAGSSCGLPVASLSARALAPQRHS